MTRDKKDRESRKAGISRSCRGVKNRKKQGWRMKNQTVFVKTFAHFSPVASILSVGSNSPFSCNRPLSPTFVCVCVWACVFWTGSLPSQLCPCARAISPSLTFTGQLPTDRPPLHYFVWMSVPLSLFSGPLKRRGKKLLSFFLHFTEKGTSHPPKIPPFLSLSMPAKV